MWGSHQIRQLFAASPFATLMRDAAERQVEPGQPQHGHLPSIPLRWGGTPYDLQGPTTSYVQEGLRPFLPPPTAQLPALMEGRGQGCLSLSTESLVLLLGKGFGSDARGASQVIGAHDMKRACWGLEWGTLGGDPPAPGCGGPPCWCGPGDGWAGRMVSGQERGEGGSRVSTENYLRVRCSRRGNVPGPLRARLPLPAQSSGRRKMLGGERPTVLSSGPGCSVVTGRAAPSSCWSVAPTTFMGTSGHRCPSRGARACSCLQPCRSLASPGGCLWSLMPGLES